MVDVNDSVAVLEAGHKALVDTLGSKGYIKFIQLICEGKGDYTKEKYEKPPMSMDKILEGLKKYQND